MTSTEREPVHEDAPCPSIELAITGRTRDLGGFGVKRVLPSMKRRMIGPFLFFDQMGPLALPVGTGMEVRPHPHIALATVTFLFEGEIMHRDSLGSHQAIHPGDVNWMVAGRGIVHSERSSAEAKAAGVRMHGIQSWVALPLEHEETEPSFTHHPRASIPSLTLPGARLDVIVGTAYGKRSPVKVFSPTLYVHVQLEPGASLPVDGEHEERAVYVVEGAIVCEGRSFEAGTLLVVKPEAELTLTAQGQTRLMLLGGAKLEGPRHMFWNFVSSSKERIEQAKDDWKHQRFPKVPGDELDFIPLPE